MRIYKQKLLGSILGSKTSKGVGKQDQREKLSCDTVLMVTSLISREL